MTKIAEIKNNNKNIIIGILIIAVIAVLFLGSITGQSILSRSATSTTTSCVWVDRYSNRNLDHTLLNNACRIANLGSGYRPIAYELRRDYWTYQDSGCTISVTQSSDHQILKNGESGVKFGENVGNMDKCFKFGGEEADKTRGLYYMTIFQMYDGALCCK